MAKEKETKEETKVVRYKTRNGNIVVGAKGKQLIGEVSPKDLNEMIAEKGDKCLVLFEKF